MRIVHFFERVRLEKGGTIRAAIDMCLAMAERGHHVSLATFDDTDVPEQWRSGAPSPGPSWPEVKMISPPPLPGGFYPPGGPTCTKTVLAGADVVHLHGLWQPSTAQYAARAADAGVPIVLSCHGMLDEWSMRQSPAKKKVYLGLFGRKFLDRVGVFHATADDEKRQASAWVPGDKIEAIPLLADFGPYRELPGPEIAVNEFGLDTNAFYALFLSRLHYKKQPDVLIKAVSKLRKQGQDVRLLLAGGGDEPYVDQLKSLAKAEGFDDDTCKFLGMVTGDTKLSVYQAADTFALPTSQENFGMVFVEALACGTPIVATKGTDIWRELDATGGTTLAEATPDAFAQAIGGLVGKKQELAAIGATARERVFEWLDADTIAKRYEAMYERAVNAKPSINGSTR